MIGQRSFTKEDIQMGSKTWKGAHPSRAGNSNEKPQRDTTTHPSEELNLKNYNVKLRMVKNWNPNTYWWEWDSHFGKLFEFLKKLPAHVQSRQFTPRYLLKKNENINPHKDSFNNVHNTFIPNGPKLGNSPTVKGYSIVQRNSTQQIKQWPIATATTWMNLKIMRLKEARPKRLHTTLFHAYNILENANKSKMRENNRYLILEEQRLIKRARGNFWGCWKCFVSWSL